MDKNDILNLIKEYGTEKNKDRILKNWPTYTGNGALLGPMRKLAKKVKINHTLALELWAINNDDVKTFATLIFDYDLIDEKLAFKLIEEIEYPPLVNELLPGLAKNNYCNKIIDRWIDSDDNIKGKASFYAILYKVLHDTVADDEIEKFLMTIERDMKDAPKEKQETMNRVLSEIGGKFSNFTDKCIKIGEKLEVYKDMKVPKGCYSPYAPLWIKLILDRKDN